MKGHVDYLFAKKVISVLVEEGEAKGVVLENGQEIHGQNVVLGVGREGAMWLQTTLESLGVKFKNNQVDIGVRVETNNIVMEEINEHLYEGKFKFNTSVGTTVRTFVPIRAGMWLWKTKTGRFFATVMPFAIYA